MPAKIQINDEMYALMLVYLDDFCETESNGTSADAEFVNQYFWLSDTAVIENLEKRNGEWHIYLVFAHHLTPLKFIKRKIVNYSCPKKASIVASFMRRQAAKDQRGTITLNVESIKINYN